MNYKAIEEITQELLALPSEELRSLIEKARKGEVAHLMFKGGFISSRGEEDFTYPDYEPLSEPIPERTIASKPKMQIVIGGVVCSNPESDFSYQNFDYACAA